MLGLGNLVQRWRHWRALRWERRHQHDQGGQGWFDLGQAEHEEDPPP